MLHQIDKEVLYDLYVGQNSTIKKCAEYFGVSSDTIRDRLDLYNIPKRSPYELHKSNLKIPMTDEMYQILRGALLGDGSLCMSKNSVNASFRYSSKSKQHVEFVTKEFLDYGQISEKDRYDKRTQKYYHQCLYYSKAAEVFTKEYYKWYINDVKHIPNDLVLTSLMCLIWYIGDGCLRGSSSSNTQDIILATNSFDKNEIEKILLPQLNEFEAKLYLVKNEQYTIRIGKRKNVVSFLNYIGECPFEDYAYKWVIKEHVKAGAGDSLFFDDENEVIFLYQYGFSSGQIAKIFGCSDSNVLYVLNKNNIQKSRRYKKESDLDFQYLENFKYDESHKDYEVRAINKFLDAHLKGVV